MQPAQEIATWSSNANGSYGQSTNWNTGTVPSGAGLVATFGTGSGQDISFFGGNYIVGTLLFNSDNYFYDIGADQTGSLMLDNSHNGGAITVSSGAIGGAISTSLVLADLSKSNMFNVAISSLLNIFGPISESGYTGQQITVTGGGTVYFDGMNSYSGGTTVNAGTTLNVGYTSQASSLGTTTSPLAINDSGSAVMLYNSVAIGSLSGTGAGLLYVSPGNTLSINQSSSTSFAGKLQLDSGANLTLSGSNNSLTISGAPSFGGGNTVTVSSGTLAFTNSTPATVSGSVSVTVAAGATLQLAGSASALSQGSNAANITTNSGGGSSSDGAVVLSGATTQTVGIVSGQTVTSSPATYSGSTTVGDGTNAANLSATQILQNSLVINAGSTVTILPSGSNTQTAQPASGAAATVAAASEASGSDVSGSSSDSSVDPFTAIQAAIASGSISNATGQVLKNRIAAIERLASVDPGLNVSLLEDRVLAVLPTSAGWSSDNAAAPMESDSGLLAADESASGSSTGGQAAEFSANTGYGSNVAPVPEPTTLCLAVLAAFGVLLAARVRNGARQQL